MSFRVKDAELPVIFELSQPATPSFYKSLCLMKEKPFIIVRNTYEIFPIEKINKIKESKVLYDVYQKVWERDKLVLKNVTELY